MKIALIILFSLFPAIAMADGKYCPETGNYDIFVVGDELVITSMTHPAYCIRTEGISYQCTEKYPDGSVSEYVVKAVEFDPGLAFFIEGNDAPWGIPACK